MQLRFQEFDGFLAFDKPFGVRTHRVNEGQYGFCEYLTEKTNQELFVVHRLDKETSGLILFAQSAQTAQSLSELFKNHQIHKTYYFLTDKKNLSTEFKVTSHIEKQEHSFINNEALPDNSETDFEFVEESGSFYLWRAFPQTGKPHQIRLHAQKAGIPVLGDREHGGSPHFRLALHAHRVEFALNGKNYSIECSIPDLVFPIQSCSDRISHLYTLTAHESYRLTHNELSTDESSPLRMDIFADHLWVYDYSALEKKLPQDLEKELLCYSQKNNLKLTIRKMLDRGSGVGGLEKSTLQTNDDLAWQASEESVRYLLKTDSGFSPGLFLDQRENRLWVRYNSKNLKVLNLFCYTAGFSVNAALGGAQEVTSVDVSKKFLNWSKENFILNQLNPEKYEFFPQDSVLFLKGALKRQRTWDLIICDPPSFGRSKDSVWKLESDLPEFAQLMFKCLKPNGKILFTCNLEKKNRQEVIQLFTQNFKKEKFEISRMPMLCLDYELTDDYRNLMKGFILTKS